MTLTRRRIVAVVLVLSLFLIAALNLAIWGFHAAQRMLSPFENAVEENYRVAIDKYYPGMRRPKINRLISETYRPVEYSPFVEFREAPRRGEYVNVSADGFRVSSDQSPWPPAPRKPIIFVFGGSTTFGYGVRDDDTVASALSRKLRQNAAFAQAQIYNFGRGFYWLAQERVLFDTLLMSGVRPDIAIFIDGLNEFARPDANPQFSTMLSSAFRHELDRSSLRGQFSNLARAAKDLVLTTPMVQFARDLRSWSSSPGASATFLPYNPGLVQPAIRNYFRNKSLIEITATQESIRTLFVWQPVPTFKYPQALHADFTARNGYSVHSQSHYAYPLMAARPELRLDRNFAWCADIQERAKSPLYVDLVHYNRQGAELLADCVIASLQRQ